MSSVAPLLCLHLQSQNPTSNPIQSELHPSSTQVLVLAWTYQDTSPCNWLSLETYGIVLSATPSHTIISAPWINAFGLTPSDDPTKSQQQWHVVPSVLLLLGAKELGCTTSWDLSTALEYDRDALWEHLLPCLFRCSWSLLKREAGPWMMTDHTHTVSIFLTALPNRSTRAGFTCFGQSRVMETKGWCSLPGQQIKVSVAV